ncbi:MAG: hypothetical protein RL516_919 [Bacteroidota bacterium]|jgi:hypothetical protein
MRLNEPEFNNRAVNRLTALWALNESGLGGILHAAKFPFTGILVGGFAIILITLIARYSNYSFKAILKATAMVLMIKAAVSPHSPFPAYLAVSFQGLLGAIVFSLSRNFKLTPIFFGGLALLESAIQKILLTVLFFGRSFWRSVDDFVLNTIKIFQLPVDFSFSESIAISYVAFYLVIGLMIGRFASKIPDLISSLDFSEIKLSNIKDSTSQNRKSKGLLFIAVLSIALSFQLISFFGGLPFMQLLARVVFFMLLFYYVIGPLTTRLILLLSRNRSEEISKLNDDVAQIRLAVKPVINHVNKNYNGISRIKMFVLYMIAISLNDIRDENE